MMKQPDSSKQTGAPASCPMDNQDHIIIMHTSKPLSASLEDYLEAIYILSLHQQEIRPKDIMARLQVSGSSVTEALHALSRRKLLIYAPYEQLALTAAGTEQGREIYRRHQALKRFFIKILGIEEALAEQGACSMEHTAPKPIIDRLLLYMQFIEEEMLGCGDLPSQFFTFVAKQNNVRKNELFS